MGLGFAYVMNQMEPGVLPNAKAARLIGRMYEGEGGIRNSKLEIRKE